MAKRRRVRTTPGNKAKYSTIAEFYGREEYFKRFFKKLHTSLVKSCGERKTKSILSLLNSKLIKIINPETFFSESSAAYDPSIKAFNESISLNDFFCGTLMNCSKAVYEGSTYVELTMFLVYASIILSSTVKGKTNTAAYAQSLMNVFISSLCTVYKRSPYVIRILDKKGYLEACDVLHLDKPNVTAYMYLIGCFFRAYDSIKNINAAVYRPTIEMIFTLYNDTKNNQESYLSRIFDLKIWELHKYTSPIEDLGTDSIEVREALKCIRSKSKYSFIDIDDVIKELKRIKDSCPFRTYGYNYTDLANLKDVSKADLTNHCMEKRYIPLECVEPLMNPAAGEVEINCNRLSLDEIHICIESAVELCLIRYRILKETFIKAIRGDIKIVLKNLHPLKKEYIEQLKDIKLKIESLHNRRFNIIMEFKEEECETKSGDNFPTHIRIISDIHADINAGRYEFNFGDDFIVNCGDTSGDCVCTTNWIRSNIRKGVFTSGNHLGYNQPFPELNGPDNIPIHDSIVHEMNTLNGQTKYLGGEFANNEVKYLNDSCYEYQDIVFIGCPLYTDFLLYGEERRDECKDYAKARMNDYKYPKAYANKERNIDPENEERLSIYKNKRIVTPDPNLHINYHYDSMRFLTEKLREYKGRPIVVFTHHAPLPYSLAPQYRNDPLSAAFASNLTRFFMKFPDIRLWAHGHVHHCNDYIFGNTRIISCPFGYYNENNVDTLEYGHRIAIADIKSKKSWEELLKEDIDSGKIKVYKSES